MENEKEILLRLSEGDEKAFSHIFRTYYSKVKSFSYGFLKDRDEAEELTQMIFIKLWEKKEAFASVNNFDSYMFTLSKYTIFNYIEARHIIPVEIDDAQDVSDTITPYDEIVANDLKLLVDLTVSEMPPQRRQIFHLSRQDGLTNDEIAVKLGIQKKTVENHLNLALKELRNVIGFVVITYIMLME